MHIEYLEYKGNLQIDAWRIDQIQRLKSNPRHPWSRFTIGNQESLKVIPSKQGIDPREELVKWYNQHYSANVMKLCVLGSGKLLFLLILFN